MSNNPPPIPNPTAAEKAPGMSVASLILGIISILGGVFLLIPAVLAIVFGHVSLAYCKRNKINAGQGMSTAGLVMGYLSILVIPVVGLLAAMAIPAFQKVRAASQEKVIVNNVRQLAAAADQYFLEHDTTVAGFRDLVGTNAYISTLNPIVGESYPDRYLKDGEIRVLQPNGTLLVYDTKTGTYAKRPASTK